MVTGSWQGMPALNFRIKARAEGTKRMPTLSIRGRCVWVDHGDAAHPAATNFQPVLEAGVVPAIHTGVHQYIAFETEGVGHRAIRGWPWADLLRLMIA